MEQTDRNKEVVRNFIRAVLQELDPTAVDDLVADDFVSHTWRIPGDAKAGLKGMAQKMGATLSDVTFQVDDLIAEDDKVVARVTSSATPIADFQGIKPTGRGYSVGEIHIFRVRDGRIAEHWHEYDAAGIVKQLKG
ncbi:MAG: ester cyclase [Chloroflexota bacterium]